MKIIVFLHGTTIMHHGALGHSRKERVPQSIEGEASVRDFASYVPVGNAVEKLRRWYEQGAEICYLSSHRKAEHVDKDRSVLERFGFPGGEMIFRQAGEQYKDVAERVMPDVLIEDDCESIGGQSEMVYPHIQSELQRRMISIVVKEFEGIDHLPDNITDL